MLPSRDSARGDLDLYVSCPITDATFEGAAALPAARPPGGVVAVIDPWTVLASRRPGERAARTAIIAP